MSSIASDRLDQGPVDRRFWPGVAGRVRRWLQSTAVPVRDAVLLLPHAGLLPIAREAFAEQGGWQPRIETTQTLVRSLMPSPAAGAGQISFDEATDALSAAALLRGQAAGAAWSRRDPRGFASAVAAMVATAHAVLRGAQERPPHERAAYWQRWRELLPQVNGPGASERWLARIAIEWAAGADPPVADVLWSWPASAWMAVCVGGGDALVDQLLGHARGRGIPSLRLDADAPAEAPFDAAARLPPPRRLRCDGLEEEAQAAALAVLEAIDRGQVPVALIAQDRIVVRRIRALLERARVALHDETGWTLSTTRAGARLMGLLRAAAADADRDGVLEWLKSQSHDDAPVLALEAQWRRGRSTDDASQAILGAAKRTLQPLRRGGRQSLHAWLTTTRAAVPDTMAALAADAAGQQLLAALHLDGGASNPAWQTAADSTQLDLAEFTAWVDATLESAKYVPPPQAHADVVITPLARALLRPFAATVMPGCDEMRLGAATLQATLLPDALLRECGLGHAARERDRERAAFAQVLRAPESTLLRRSSDGGEPLAASRLIAHAWQARRRLGEIAPEEALPVLPQASVACLPTPRPAPSAGQALPARLSASAVEALRACPYRFFAFHVLGLRESPELDAELEKRDYGTWLHGVLLRFHQQRPATGAAATDRPRLLAAADDEQAALALDAAQLLPFRAAFEGFALHYLEWLHVRDAEGWRFEAGELALRCEPGSLDGAVLDGRIDRIDVHQPSGTRQLIDYKTGSAQALRGRVAEPLEDTQLAFYAALVGDAGPLRATYLALDDRRPPQAIEHPDVAASASSLVAGLAHDLARLRQGAGLPALGEDPTCEYCEARGLCRRDHWSGEAAP